MPKKLDPYKNRSRYRVPQFPGQDHVPNLAKRIYSALKSNGAETVLLNRRYGCLTFRLDEPSKLPAIVEALSSIHPMIQIEEYKTGGGTSLPEGKPDVSLTHYGPPLV